MEVIDLAEDRSSRSWLRPRYPLEMALASAATLATVLVVGSLGQHASAPPKATLAAAPFKPDDSGDARTAEFMENFALAHVRAPLPESAIADPPSSNSAPSSAPPPRAAVAVMQLQRARPKPVVAPAKPAAKPVEPVQTVAATASNSVPPRAEQKSFRIPFVSDTVDKLPSGRDIVDGVGAVGQKIGSLFK